MHGMLAKVCSLDARAGSSACTCTLARQQELEFSSGGEKWHVPVIMSYQQTVLGFQ